MLTNSPLLLNLGHRHTANSKIELFGSHLVVLGSTLKFTLQNQPKRSCRLIHPKKQDFFLLRKDLFHGNKLTTTKLTL